MLSIAVRKRASLAASRSWVSHRARSSSSVMSRTTPIRPMGRPSASFAVASEMATGISVPSLRSRLVGQPSVSGALPGGPHASNSLYRPFGQKG